MTPIALKIEHDQPVAALAKKAGAKLDQLMTSQSDAVFSYAWEPGGSRCAVSVICGGTFIVQCTLAILEKEVTLQGMIMDSTSSKPKAEADTLAKVQKLLAGLVAGKKKK